MSGTYSITFTNSSSVVTFNRSVFGLRTAFGSPSTNNPFLGLTQSPNTTLPSTVGVQTIAADTNTVSLIVTGGYHDLFCVWRNPGNGQRFGVLIHAPLQLFSIGTGPYYEVMYDTTPDSDPDQEPSWQATGQDPSSQYNWTQLTGLVINATPTAGHQDMSIEVLINDAPSTGTPSAG